MVTALLLDLDGTLVDSEPVHRAGYRAFFAARGWEEPDLALFTGRRAEDVFSTMPGPWAGLDPEELAAEVVGLTDYDAQPEPVRGAEELFAEALRLGVRVAVVTSAGPSWVQRTLGEGLGLLENVEVVVTSEDVADGKPHPAGYLRACEALDVPPEHALAVEDSPSGVRSAAAAGVGQVVGLSTTHDEAALLDAGATVVRPDLLGVVPLLRN